MKRILTGPALTLGLGASLTLGVFAQQSQQPAAQDGDGADGPHRRMGREGRRHRRGDMKMRGMGRFALRSLNLTDAQQQRIHEINENHEQSTRAQREELRQLFQQRRDGGELGPDAQARARELGAQLREAGRNVREEVLAVLTTEQRAQLEQLKQQRRQKRGQFRQEPNDDREQ